MGFAYQLAFIKLHNRLAKQSPFEVIGNLLAYVSVQLELEQKLIDEYCKRQPTLSEYQERIRLYLGLRRFNEIEDHIIEQYLFEQACRLEQTLSLMAPLKDFFTRAIHTGAFR